MSTPLLSTKLYIPPTRPQLVARPGLIGQLNTALATAPNVTLISVPAGFGKTTLISGWLRQIDPVIPTTWLSLDKSDNDPSRFLTYLIVAWQRIDPGIGQSVKALLRGAQWPHPSLEPAFWSDANWSEAIITALVNELAAVPSKFICVLDDYHLIEAQPVHDILTFLASHLPPQMRLVIITRTDPPLPLALLRGRGQLLELRLSDLRFNLEETVTFLRQVMGLDLSIEEAQALETQTEGWVTGLQLAALAMRSYPSASPHQPGQVRDFISSFTSTHRYILDYLTDEVLSRQPEATRRFLLQTSILNRLCAPLCEAVVECDHSLATLQYLDANNLFIIPLDGERRWYRYHHLFGSLLRHHLKQAMNSQDVAQLHQRACAWYSQHGFIEDALGHALAAGNPEQAAALVAQNSETMLKRGEIRTLQRWLRLLPAELIRQRPRLSLDYAWMLLAQYQFDEVESYLQAAEPQLATAAASMRAEINIIRAMLIRLQGDAPRAIALYQQTLQPLPAHDLFLAGLIYLDLGRAYVLNDDLAAASESLARAITLNQASQHQVAVLQAMCMLARVRVSQGRLHQAAETYQRAMQVATEETNQGLSTLSAVGMAYAGLAEIEREWHNLDRATEYALKAIELGHLGGLAGSLVHGYLALARIQEARLDLAGALETLQEVEQIIRRANIQPWLARVAAYQAQLRLRQYQVEGREAAWQASLNWAYTSDLLKGWRQQEPVINILSHTFNFEHLTLARVFIAQGKFDEALELLAWLLQRAEATGRLYTTIEILVLQAVIWQAQHCIERALAALGRACLLAEPENYVHIFVDQGRPMTALLSKLLEAQPKEQEITAITANYVARLLATFPNLPSMIEDSTSNTHYSKIANRPIEPLSLRELEVLRLLAVGQTNRQIAEKLTLAVGTVRRHTNNIYGKLQVRNRTEAAAHARELQLL